MSILEYHRHHLYLSISLCSISPRHLHSVCRSQQNLTQLQNSVSCDPAAECRRFGVSYCVETSLQSSAPHADVSRSETLSTTAICMLSKNWFSAIWTTWIATNPLWWLMHQTAIVFLHLERIDLKKPDWQIRFATLRQCVLKNGRRGQTCICAILHTTLPPAA